MPRWCTSNWLAVCWIGWIGLSTRVRFRQIGGIENQKNKIYYAIIEHTVTNISKTYWGRANKLCTHPLKHMTLCFFPFVRINWSITVSQRTCLHKTWSLHSLSLWIRIFPIQVAMPICILFSHPICMSHQWMYCWALSDHMIPHLVRITTMSLCSNCVLFCEALRGILDRAIWWHVTGLVLVCKEINSGWECKI